MSSLEGAYTYQGLEEIQWLSRAVSSQNSQIQPNAVPSNNDAYENISEYDEPSSISSLSIYSASGDDDANSVSSSQEDLESRIAFLHEKQKLLERAMKALQREELYEASIAPSVIDKSHPSCNISSIVEEARTMLKALNEDEDDDDVVVLPSSSQSQSKRKQDSSDSIKESSKRLKIDITNVSRRVATQEDTPVPVSEDEEDDDAEPYPMQGKWMAKSFLRYHKPSFNASRYENWKIKRDPYVGNVAVPPSPTPFERETELKVALSFTSTPQLITSAVPPFNVVHANAAFAILSGRNDIVGSSVETIFQVDSPVEEEGEEQDSKQTNVHQIFPNQILLNGKACQIALTPIVDRGQNPKGGVSHLLLQVRQGDADAIQMQDIPLSSITNTTRGAATDNGRKVFLTTIGWYHYIKHIQGSRARALVLEAH